MTNPHDSIRVGSITLVYSSVRRGWLAPGGQVIQNPLKAQRLAEQLNSKKGCSMTGKYTLIYADPPWAYRDKQPTVTAAPVSNIQ
jgi:16S rRNA G966 N2-methylase RsmD